MLGYVSMGTNNFEQALAFYDELFAVCGGKRMMEFEGFIVWGTSMDAAMFAIARPFNGEPATVGNGVMAAIQVDSQEAVAAMYNKALELGGKDEGAPGQRGEGFYAAYFRDLDGNKLNAFVAG